MVFYRVHRKHLPSAKPCAGEEIEEPHGLIPQHAPLLPVREGTGVQEHAGPALGEGPWHDQML
jgi:hypothetical protein